MSYELDMEKDGIHYAPSVEMLSRRMNSVVPQALRSGRIPPQALEMEQGVLGAILLEKSAMDRIEDVLRVEMLYKEGHKLIYEACQQLRLSGSPIDLLTVKNQLSSTGMLEAAGGQYYLTELTSKVSSAANIEYHARTISQKWLMREIIKIGDDAVNRGFDETTDVFELYDSLQQQMLALFVNTTGNMRSMVDDWKEGIDQAEKAMVFRDKMGDMPITGVATGLHKLDAIMTGLQRKDLIIIGARPSMGKTTLALNMAINAAANGVHVLFFSLEMDRQQIYRRIASIKAGLNPRDVVSGKISVEGLGRYGNAWAKATGIHIDDKAGVDAGYIKRVSKGRMKAGGQYLIIVDYLQLMAGMRERNGNREQEIASIARALKQLAKDTDTPVAALSQLSRSVETRGGDKKPMMSDLRESGSIEQDADVVMFCYRPEYYGLTTYEDGSSTSGIGEIIIAKQRNGPVGEIKLGWDPRIKGWYNLGEADDDAQGNLFPDPKRVQPKNLDFSSPINSEENEDFFDKTPRDDVF